MKVSAIQLSPGADIDQNLARAVELTAEACADGARFVALPEYFALYDNSEGWQKPAADKSDAILEAVGAIAKSKAVHILAGSVLLPSGHEGKFENVSILFGPDGLEAARYVKRNLFVAEVDGNSYREGDWLQAGDSVVKSQIDQWNVGLSTCFDLRFAEHYTALRAQGANIITAPSAFTKQTGQAHWMTLVRARAIETQSYMIAPALVGETAPGVECYGSTVIVDPWGEPVALLETGEGYISAELDMTLVESVRRRINMTRGK